MNQPTIRISEDGTVFVTTPNDRVAFSVAGVNIVVDFVRPKSQPIVALQELRLPAIKLDTQAQALFEPAVASTSTLRRGGWKKDNHKRGRCHVIPPVPGAVHYVTGKPCRFRLAKIFVCKTCGKAYAKPSSLERHSKTCGVEQ